MTNTEIIQAVRNEIEQMKSIEYPCDNSEQATGFCDALDRMTDFLSTLESEKPMNLDDAMKELDEKIALVKQRGTWKGVDVDKYMDEIRGREPEKPMNLEEEINRYLHEECSDDDEPGIHEIAEHFAKWGYLRAAEKYNEIEYNRQRAEESVPNDLEEAARDYAWDDYGIIYEGERVNGYIIDHVKDAFIAGAEWQKEQMMKEGAEGEIRKDGTIGYFEFSNEQQFHSLLEKFQDCDKVRIIVCKKDD